jgi:hypothetical protein
MRAATMASNMKQSNIAISNNTVPPFLSLKTYTSAIGHIPFKRSKADLKISMKIAAGDCRCGTCHSS